MAGSTDTRDSGIDCLIVIARFHQISLSADQLRHKFAAPGSSFSAVEIQRSAIAVGLKARQVNASIERLEKTPLPAIAEKKNGKFFILVRVSKNEEGLRFLIHDLSENKSPATVTEHELENLWSGKLILVARSLKHNETSKKFNLAWFIPSLKKYKRFFAEVLLASFFVQLLALATPIFFQVVMDKVLVHRGFTTLDVLAIGFFIVVVFEALLGWLRQYVFAHTTSRVDVELGSRLFDHLVSLPMSYFSSRQVGQSVARVRELDSLRNFITGTALTLLIDLTFTFIFIAVMWYYSPVLTWVVLGTIPCYLIMSLFINPQLRQKLNQKFNDGAENQSFLTEAVTGMETVKAMAIEPQMQRRWEGQLSRYVKSSFQSQNLSNTANQLAGLINKIMTLLIIWIGAKLVIAGSLTVGQLVAFNMLAGRVSGPILKLVQLWQEFQQAGISLQRLGDILNSPRENRMASTRNSLPKLRGDVVFDNVSFSYGPDLPPILRELNLNVRAGEVIGIVGRSGSGKSTLTKLLQGLHPVSSGRLIVDGMDVSNLDMQWLRRNVGAVLQDSFLFSASVRENIAIRDPGAPLERVINAARLAGAHDFIQELPQGYDTVLNEQARNLSGGQRQRLAIARTLLNEPKILILDEATSALDYESERIIQENMPGVCANRTVFIIAHRLSSVRQCDRIVVLDQGRVVEEGTHPFLCSGIVNLAT